MKVDPLRDIVEAHARWIAGHTQQGARAQLSGQRLHAANFEGADLRWAHLRDSALLQLASHVLEALPELSPLAPDLVSPAWHTGVGDGYDTYEVCAVGDRPGLTIRLSISRCDSSAGPVETQRDSSFHVVMPNGDAVLLGWCGSGGLEHRHGDPQLFERVCSHQSTASVRLD